MNCRAITTNILQSISSKTFLQSLRRFIASNGCLKLIICDNAPTFKAFSEAQMKEIATTDQYDVLDYCAQQRIQFKFIPALSPWQGGFYERMIGIFKSSLKHAVNNRILHLDDLRTLSKESETICNSRPLIYVGEQLDFIPLRPIDFIRPFSRLSTPHFLDDHVEWKPAYSTRESLIKDWRQSLQLLDSFWNRWSSEYLTSLRESHQVSHPHPRIHLN